MAKHEPEKHGGILKGSDGRMQGRKAAAVVCFLLGIGLLVYGAAMPVGMPLDGRIGPALVALCFSLLFWGLLTIQNVFQLVALIKSPRSPKEDHDDR